MLSTSEILAAANRFKRFYGDRINEIALVYGLSKVEMDVLLFLYNNPQYDTARDIVEFRHIAKSYVSKAVELLVKKDALTVKEDGRDRRVLHLKVSDCSLEAVEMAKSAQERVMKDLFKGLTAEEQRTFERVLRKMSYNIEEVTRTDNEEESIRGAGL